jgi:hypothetical protein
MGRRRPVNASWRLRDLRDSFQSTVRAPAKGKRACRVISGLTPITQTRSYAPSAARKALCFGRTSRAAMASKRKWSRLTGAFTNGFRRKRRILSSLSATAAAQPNQKNGCNPKSNCTSAGMAGLVNVRFWRKADVEVTEEWRVQRARPAGRRHLTGCRPGCRPSNSAPVLRCPRPPNSPTCPTNSPGPSGRTRRRTIQRRWAHHYRP